MHFRKSDVIDTGNIYDTTRYPLIDVKNGGTIQGEIDALNSGQGRPRRPVPVYFALLAVNSTSLPSVKSSGRRPNAIWSPSSLPK